jgi:hypothetical protein
MRRMADPLFGFVVVRMKLNTDNSPVSIELKN